MRSVFWGCICSSLRYVWNRGESMGTHKGGTTVGARGYSGSSSKSGELKDKG